MLPYGYPIFHPFLTREPEGLSAEVTTILHTLGRRELTLRINLLINQEVEPRALSAPHGPRMLTEVYTRRERCTPWYTQGVVGWCIPGYVASLPWWVCSLPAMVGTYSPAMVGTYSPAMVVFPPPCHGGYSRLPAMVGLGLFP